MMAGLANTSVSKTYDRSSFCFSPQKMYPYSKVNRLPEPPLSSSGRSNEIRVARVSVYASKPP
jgi:hypothetical protein